MSFIVIRACDSYWHKSVQEDLVVRYAYLPDVSQSRYYMNSLFPKNSELVRRVDGKMVAIVKIFSVVAMPPEVKHLFFVSCRGRRHFVRPRKCQILIDRHDADSRPACPAFKGL
jgi:hypothetical protein